MSIVALQFYLGRAGSGKSRQCLDDIVERLREDPTPASPPLIWLLPEQATAQAERAILRVPGIGGFARAHVVSFRRLSHLILREAGASARRVLTEDARQMLLRSIVSRCRGDLYLFGRSAQQQGFIARLSAFFREMAQFRQTWQTLEAESRRLESAESPAPVLALKLHDLALIGREYAEAVAAGFRDPDHFLDDLAEGLAETGYFERAEVWIDNFASFMPQELRVIEQIARSARIVRVALLLDPDDAPPADPFAQDRLRLFSKTEETRLRLERLVSDLGLEILPPRIFPEAGQPTRFSDSPHLDGLEQALRRTALLGIAHGRSIERNEPKIGLPDTWHPIAMLEASSRREEAEAVARAIRRICREEGERYRDIGVVVRSLEHYHHHLRAAFESNDIPFFMDRREPVSHHPLVELLRSALSVVLNNWPLEDVVQYLKTDFAPITRYDADRVENYALAHDLQGRARWMDRRRVHAALATDDLAGEIEAIGAKALAPLARLSAAIEGTAGDAHSPSNPQCRAIDFVAALRGFLEDLAAPEVLAEWTREAEQSGRLDTAEEHQLVWDAVVGIFEQMVDVLGDTALDVDQLVDVLATGLANLTLGLVPPALDQVLIGTIDRSRQPELKTVFVMGLNEHVFPSKPAEDAILSDRERNLMAEDAVELAPGSADRLLRERYLAYVAFTRPSRRLWVSWAMTDDDGVALASSPLLQIMENCCAGAGIPIEHVRVTVPWLRESLDAPERAAQAIDGRALSRHPDQRDSRDWTRLGDLLSGMDEARDLLRNMEPVATAQGIVRLDPALAAAMVPQDRPIGVTRLETYAACPFQFFAGHALRLQERQTSQIQASDIGTLYHLLLNDVFHILASYSSPLPLGKGALDWGRIEPEQGRAALDMAIHSNRDRFDGEGSQANPRTQFFIQRTVRLLGRVIDSCIVAGREDRFIQVAGEYSFRSDPMRFTLDDGAEMKITGTIDRIDLAQDERDDWCVRIIDFKSSDHRFIAQMVLHGRALQLPLYLEALRRRMDPPLRLAGAFYLNITPKIAKGRPASDQDEMENDPVLPPLRMRGAFDKDLAPLFADLEPGESAQGVRLVRKRTGDFDYHAVRSDVLEAGLLDRICSEALRQARSILGSIRSGRFDVAPVTVGNNSPCSWCPYNGVCRIDWGCGKRRIFAADNKKAMEELLARPGLDDT